MNANITYAANAPDISEKLTILAGQDAKRPLNPDTKKQLSTAYFQLYFGLSGINWANKNYSLGMAWQKALTQIDAFVQSKRKDNPAAMYLHQINAAHKTAWPQQIMTHAQRDSMLQATKEKEAAFRKYSQDQVKSALGTISLILARHQVKDIQLAAEQQEEATQTKITEIEQVHVKHVYVEQIHEVQSEQAQTMTQQHATAPAQQLQQNAVRQAQANTAVQSQTNAMQNRAAALPRAAKPAAVKQAQPNAKPVQMRVIKPAMQQTAAKMPAVAKKPMAKPMAMPKRVQQPQEVLQQAKKAQTASMQVQAKPEFKTAMQAAPATRQQRPALMPAQKQMLQEKAKTADIMPRAVPEKQEKVLARPATPKALPAADKKPAFAMANARILALNAQRMQQMRPIQFMYRQSYQRSA